MTNRSTTSKPAVIWLAMVTLVPLTLCERDESCYSTDDNPYSYFGTRTSYDTVRNPQGIPQVPGCTPLQLWMVGRHGERWTNPSEPFKTVDMMDLKEEILNNHERGRGTLCSEDLSRLRIWRETLVSARETDSLTSQGLGDAYTLGLRVHQAFPALFVNSSATKDFEFYHTELDRTRATAEYFAKGLFGFVYSPKFPNGLDNIRLIEAHEDCPAWLQKNAELEERFRHFTRGALLYEMYRSISQRLGFNYDLPFYVVDAMYRWCVQERSTSLDHSSAWCGAFSANELKVMEFLEDLKYYYKTGPGDKMNEKLGCPLVRDMLMRFKEIEQNPAAPRPRGVFYFGQTEAVGLVASRLGLFEDPRFSSFSSRVDYEHPTFRTSAVLPWGANVMAVFFRCSSGDPYQVMFLVSEYVVQPPGCPSGLCPWSLLQRRLSDTMNTEGCPLDFCSKVHYSWIPHTQEELWAIIVIFATIFFIVHLFRVVHKLTE